MHKNTRYYITEYDDRTVIRAVPVQTRQNLSSTDKRRESNHTSSTTRESALRKLANRGIRRSRISNA